tara:strand:- start:5183 stop:5305 length:123 start_codon:yes stop_codon:yes gene_type:complete
MLEIIEELSSKVKYYFLYPGNKKPPVKEASYELRKYYQKV